MIRKNNLLLCLLVGGIAGGIGERYFSEKEANAKRGIVLGKIEIKQDFNRDGRDDFLSLDEKNGKYNFRVSKKDGGYEKTFYVPGRERFVTESGIIYDIFGNEIEKEKVK